MQKIIKICKVLCYLLFCFAHFGFADIECEPEAKCDEVYVCPESCDEMNPDCECCSEDNSGGAPKFCDFVSAVLCPRECDCYPLGFYLGGSVNYTHFWGNHTDYINNHILDGSQKFCDDACSVNLFFGYLTCVPCYENVVFGVEPYISAYNYNKYSAEHELKFALEGTAEFACRRRTHGGVAFRLGYIMPCNFLVYGLVGPDIARFEFKGRESDSPKGVTSSKNLCGIIYGLGVEKPLCWCNVILGLQATVTQYKSHTFSGIDTEDVNIATHTIHPRVFDLAFRLSVPLN